MSSDALPSLLSLLAGLPRADSPPPPEIELTIEQAVRPRPAQLPPQLGTAVSVSVEAAPIGSSPQHRLLPPLLPLRPRTDLGGSQHPHTSLESLQERPCTTGSRCALPLHSQRSWPSPQHAPSPMTKAAPSPASRGGTPPPRASPTCGRMSPTCGRVSPTSSFAPIPVGGRWAPAPPVSPLPVGDDAQLCSSGGGGGGGSCAGSGFSTPHSRPGSSGRPQPRTAMPLGVVSAPRTFPPRPATSSPRSRGGGGRGGGGESAYAPPRMAHVEESRSPAAITEIRRSPGRAPLRSTAMNSVVASPGRSANSPANGLTRSATKPRLTKPFAPTEAMTDQDWAEHRSHSLDQYTSEMAQAECDAAEAKALAAAAACSTEPGIASLNACLGAGLSHDASDAPGGSLLQQSASTSLLVAPSRSAVAVCCRNPDSPQLDSSIAFKGGIVAYPCLAEAARRLKEPLTRGTSPGKTQKMSGGAHPHGSVHRVSSAHPTSRAVAAACSRPTSSPCTSPFESPCSAQSGAASSGAAISGAAISGATQGGPPSLENDLLAMRALGFAVRTPTHGGDATASRSPSGVQQQHQQRSSPAAQQQRRPQTSPLKSSRSTGSLPPRSTGSPAGPGTKQSYQVRRAQPLRVMLGITSGP